MEAAEAQSNYINTATREVRTCGNKSGKVLLVLTCNPLVTDMPHFGSCQALHLQAYPRNERICRQPWSSKEAVMPEHSQGRSPELVEPGGGVHDAVPGEDIRRLPAALER